MKPCLWYLVNKLDVPTLGSWLPPIRKLISSTFCVCAAGIFLWNLIYVTQVEFRNFSFLFQSSTFFSCASCLCEYLSYNVVTVSSHYLIFYQHMYARQLSNRSIFHAGRYLDDKEICYLGTVIVTANVCRALEWLNTGHISVLKYRHL